VTAAAKPGQIVPVDSEHSALAQCLRGGTADEVARLVLTASGGPFRGRSREELATVTVAQALAHPTWDMGPVVTINSATLVNKGLELIEAHLLFAVPYDRIDVVVHPQSVVHSMVEFVDGTVLAQLGVTDMRMPIQYALSYPDKWPAAIPGIDFAGGLHLDFEVPDHDRFPCLSLAYRALAGGGALPTVLNAANEEAVSAFLDRRVAFPAIQEVMEEPGPRLVRELDDILTADAWARERTREALKRRALETV
jgi:1-deoxy-D-xylulose-5-phosphate reductoisomerase